MEKIINFIMNNVVSFWFVVLILVVLAGCSGWKDVVKPPVFNPTLAADKLFSHVAEKVKQDPEAKEIVGKILTEIKSKLPLIEDGELTVNDAFTAISAVAPPQYKIFVLSAQVLFNATIGDRGKQIPAEFMENILSAKQIIELLEGKLKK